MKNDPTIVCLCGSTRFAQAFMDAYAERTDAGEIVLSVGRFQPVHGWDAEKKAKLDELHKRKIDLADYVLVLNVGGYIGSSTRSEIDYAIGHGKPVHYLEHAAGCVTIPTATAQDQQPKCCCPSVACPVHGLPPGGACGGW